MAFTPLLPGTPQNLPTIPKKVQHDGKFRRILGNSLKRRVFLNPMSALLDDIAQRIKSELTQPLWDRLLLHADICVRRHIWHGVLGGLPLHGNSAEDYLQNAVVKTLCGDRKWKPENCSLEQHLKGVIDSDINHASMRPMNQKIVREGALSAEDSTDSISPFDRFPCETPAIEEIEAQKEWENMIFEFLSELTDDKPVQQLFEAIYDGTLKRADQAKALQVPETQLDALKKRLTTRVRKFAADQTQKSKEVPHA